jgi:hypothetical protein
VRETLNRYRPEDRELTSCQTRTVMLFKVACIEADGLFFAMARVPFSLATPKIDRSMPIVSEIEWILNC